MESAASTPDRPPPSQNAPFPLVSPPPPPTSSHSDTQNRQNKPTIPGNDDKNSSHTRENESDDLLSDYTSETTFFDETGNSSVAHGSTAGVKEEIWNYECYKTDGKVHIFGEWTSKTKVTATRFVVIGPDWPCVIMTYIVIVVPSVFVYLYIVDNLAEEIIFFLIFGLCIFGLTTVFIADPGLVRKYHHARDRTWTYCDHCESFRPPKTVHCSTCQVCVAFYDHHCPWTGKCVGGGNLVWFKVFVISLSWLIIFYVVLAILDAVDVE